MCFFFLRSDFNHLFFSIKSLKRIFFRLCLNFIETHFSCQIVSSITKKREKKTILWSWINIVFGASNDPNGCWVQWCNTTLRIVHYIVSKAREESWIKFNPSLKKKTPDCVNLFSSIMNGISAKRYLHFLNAFELQLVIILSLFFIANTFDFASAPEKKRDQSVLLSLGTINQPSIWVCIQFPISNW